MENFVNTDFAFCGILKLWPQIDWNAFPSGSGYTFPPLEPGL